SAQATAPPATITNAITTARTIYRTRMAIRRERLGTGNENPSRGSDSQAGARHQRKRAKLVPRPGAECVALLPPQGPLLGPETGRRDWPSSAAMLSMHVRRRLLRGQRSRFCLHFRGFV